MLWAFKLTKNANFDHCKYSGYGIWFDSHESFSLSNVSRFGQNVIIFGVDTSSSVHIDNNKKKYLDLW